jgi:membrane protein YdbS with pleckstrin-like domain
LQAKSRLGYYTLSKDYSLQNELRGVYMPDIFTNNNDAINDELVDVKTSNQIRMLSSFCENPIGIAFAQQENDEKILLFLRGHFIANFIWILITLVLLLVPILFFIFRSQLQLLGTIDLPLQFVLIFVIFYYLTVFAYAFINFLSWFYNVFIVTQKRIVDIDYSNIVIHNVAFTKLSHVQDVNYTQTGFIHALFNYGNIFVQTAGNEVNFEALSVPKPRQAAHIIANLIGKESHKT